MQRERRGYSNAVAADQILVQQVRHKAGKIKGGDFPHPKSAAALLGPGGCGDNGKAGTLNDINESDGFSRHRGGWD